MAYHRGGHAGAVAVSYSTNAMSTPMSPSRRYSSGSTGTTTSGVGSSSSSFRSSVSASFDRPSYYSYGYNSSTHRSTHSSEYRRLCSPARSLSVSSSTYSDTGASSSGASGSNASKKYSGSSSRDRSETRETLGSIVASTADLYAKYSPANYVPNITGSNERNCATINGYANSTCNNSIGSNSTSNYSTSAIFGGNAANAKKISSIRENPNELSSSTGSIIHGRPPRATRRSPISTVINNHAQPDSAANEVTELDVNGDKNDRNNNESLRKINGNENDESIISRVPGNLNYRTTLYSASSEADEKEIYPDSVALKINNSLTSFTINSGASGGVKINSACVLPIINKADLLTNTEITNNNLDADDGGSASDGVDGDSGGTNERSNVNATNFCSANLTTFVKEDSSLFELSSGDEARSPASHSSSFSSPSSSSSSLLDLTSGFAAANSVVRKNGVSRPSGNHAGDNNSLPSTSRRGDSYTGNGSTSNASNGLGNHTQSATTQQNIYRGIADQIEGSPTIRAPRNRLQTPRDERCGLNGLRNIGNTCFMNSVIQCLSNTRPLLEYLVNEQYLADINTATSSMKGALIKAFSQVIQELWEVGGDHVVNTASLKSQIQRFAPRFMGYSQQDAQEFLRYLLEGLHEDVNRVTVKPQPIHTDIPDHYSDSQKAAESWKRYLRNEDSTIVDVFVGQLRSSLHCTSCGHVSVTLDPFWDLSLPIPTRSGTVKLNQCLEHFTREEVLDGDEKPTCSKCQVRRKCTKSFSIQKFPKILVIHLKRFSPMERFRGKLNTLVDFPLTGLDLGAFSAPRVAGCTYNLYGVANHSGTTYSGHYTAYCKHPYSGEWHEYNDSRVSSIAARSVVSSEGYVLFYEQQPHSSNL